MKKYTKKLLAVLFMFSLLLSSSVSVSANETEEQTKTTVHQVQYEIYDSEGNFKGSGILPLEDAPQTRLPYYDLELENGETAFLRNYNTGGDFHVMKNQTVRMSFGLDRNANISASIHNNYTGRSIKQWSGFTGGLAISAVTTDTINQLIGTITNYSSERVTVTWAKFEF